MKSMYIQCKVCGSSARKKGKSKFPDLCVKCSERARSREWREKNREREKEMARIRRHANLDKHNSQNRAWSKANPEKVKASRKKSYEKNKKENDVSWSLSWSRKNKVKISAYRATWQEKNKEKILETKRKWHEKNPESRKMHQHKRRARQKSSIGGSYTISEWKLVLKKQKNMCFDCGKKLKLTVGHLVPLSKGGSNTIINIVAQCFKCNLKQGSKIHPTAVISLFDQVDK